MKAVQSLPVLIPSVPGQRWSCHSCGDCCRTLVGHLTAEEKERIDVQGWEAELDVAPVVWAGRQWVLNKRPDGACVFLDSANRCMIHAKFGFPAKPLACRIFPFSARSTPEGMQISLRFDCPSVTSSRGELLRSHRDSLRSLSDELAGPTRGRPVRLKGRLIASDEEQRGITERVERWMLDTSHSFNTRIQVLARFVGMLSQAKLRRVRDRRLLELTDLLLGALPAELKRTPPQVPTARQEAMLRQFAFACSEHVSLEDLASGPLRKLAIRREQLAKSKRYLLGQGFVPPIRGIDGSARFQEVERIRPVGPVSRSEAESDGSGPADPARTAPRAVAHREGVEEEQAMTSREGKHSDMEDLLTRYVLARLMGRTVFGAGYYGWPVVHGIGALCVSVAAAGWIARFQAATEGRERLTLDDAARAIGIVDRSATRVPILGRFSERGRVSYLMGDDGLARLLARFAFTEENP